MRCFYCRVNLVNEEVFCKKNVHSAHRVIVPLAGKEADRAILAKNSVRIYTILCSKAWLYSERMKHGEADRTLQGKEIKCKKSANNLLLAPFFEAFIGGVSSTHGEEKVKKSEFEEGWGTQK